MKLKYKDYEIEFCESGQYPDYVEGFSCNALNMFAKSYKALKAQIDKWDVSTRRLGGIKVIKLHSYGFRESVPLTAQTIVDDESVWCVTKKKAREKANIADLCWDNVENWRLLEEAEELEKKATSITKDAQKLRSSIPRITIQELRDMAGNLIDSETPTKE